MFFQGKTYNKKTRIVLVVQKDLWFFLPIFSWDVKFEYHFTLSATNINNKILSILGLTMFWRTKTDKQKNKIIIRKNYLLRLIVKDMTDMFQKLLVSAFMRFFLSIRQTRIKMVVWQSLVHQNIILIIYWNLLINHYYTYWNAKIVTNFQQIYNLSWKQILQALDISIMILWKELMLIKNIFVSN